MTLSKLILTSSLLCAVPFTAFGADQIPDEDLAVEEIPNKKLERRGERIKGPITAISAGGMLFASFDRNEDYTVDSTEFTAGVSRAFKAADKDASKTLSLFELEDWRKAALGSLDAAPGTLAFDKDYNQRVTRDEFDHALDFVFKVGDKNDDGRLEFLELVKVFEMPRRPVLDDEENAIDRVNRQGRQNEQRRRGF
ncbi:hypothetical protein N9W89_10830 [Hellea sp.]|nr:hypothetical protein [Hellea sp.]